MDCSRSGSSVHGMLQARILEWVAIFSSSASYRRTDGNFLCVSCIRRQTLYQLSHRTPFRARDTEGVIVAEVVYKHTRFLHCHRSPLESPEGTRFLSMNFTHLPLPPARGPGGGRTTAFCCPLGEPASSEESVWHGFARLSLDTSHRAKGRSAQKEPARGRDSSHRDRSARASSTSSAPSSLPPP